MKLAARAKAIGRAIAGDDGRQQRPTVLAALVFLGVIVGYLVFFAPDDELRRSEVLPAFGALTTVLLGYLGLKRWADINGPQNPPE